MPPPPSQQIRKNTRRHFYNEWLGGLAVLLALAALVLEYGFHHPLLSPAVLLTGQILAALFFWVYRFNLWLVIERREFSWRRPLLDAVLLSLLFSAFLFLPKLLTSHCSAVLHRAAFQIYLFLLAAIRIGRFSVVAASSGRAPTLVLLISFAAIILTGAILLMLPAAHHEGRLGFTDAVFTATSATCVTGLIVRDTGTDFTLSGQLIILGMIQIGGLGIMIFGTLFAILLGSRLSLRESIAMRDILNEQAPGRIGRLVVFICGVTFIFEALGTVALLHLWDDNHLFNSVFHAVSAFCNAGFALQSDSLISYRTAWRVYAVFCPLILIGGLGFPVLHNLGCMIWTRLRFQLDHRRRGFSTIKQDRLNLHSKIALLTSLLLLLFGLVLFALLEYTRPDTPADYHYAWFRDSLFNTITARTAGFNTVDISRMSAAAKLVFIFLMSIGGSPSSTAGGLKTVTFAVMVLAVYATIRRRPEVHAFRRAIPTMIIRRVATLILLYGLLLWLITLLLTITEHSQGADLLDLMFEAASALGTVGLSTGVTAQLGAAGKWVIIAAMFIGRLGPLSLLAALTFNTRTARYDYPHEPLIVG